VRTAAAIPPTIYYSKVAFEISKLVFRGQKMTPPYVFFSRHVISEVTDPYNRSDLATFQSNFKLLFKLANLALSARNAIQTVRSANAKDLAFVGVLGAELLGFFAVGEIIGRRKLIGYRGKVDAHH